MLRGREALVRQVDGDADRAEPDPRVLPARADEEARRQRQQDRARPRHRRGRDGRRHRGLVRRPGHAGHARRHEAGADRRRDQARRRSVRQDPAQAHRHARRAGPADPGHARRGRPQRRSHHRGGAGEAGAEAEGLCRARAEDEAGRDPRHQHVEHSAAGSAHDAAKARAAARTAFLQSGVAAATGRGRQPRRHRSADAEAGAGLCRRHRPAAAAGQESRRAFSSTAR